MLAVAQQMRVNLRGMAPGAKDEAELGWFGWSELRDLSRDGKKVLFEEEGEGGGPNYTVFLRDTDGSPPVRIGEGRGEAISPDNKWVVTQSAQGDGPLRLVPTGAGQARQLTHDKIRYIAVKYFPDGQHLLAVGLEPGHGARDYIIDVKSGDSQPLTPEGTVGISLSPDGKVVLVTGPDGSRGLWPIDGSGMRPIPGLQPGFVPLDWTADGGSLYLIERHGNRRLQKVYRMNLATGKMELWKTFGEGISSGVTCAGGGEFAKDNDAYAYIWVQRLSVGYLVRGLK